MQFLVHLYFCLLFIKNLPSTVPGSRFIFFSCFFKNLCLSAVPVQGCCFFLFFKNLLPSAVPVPVIYAAGRSWRPVPEMSVRM